MISLFTLVANLYASEVFMSVAPNGTLIFTDTPKDETYVQFDVNGPPPQKEHIKLKNFPLLNAWDDYIWNASITYGVPFELIKAICIAESGMNPSAESHVGAMGLMQLMPKTAEGLGVVDPWDPEQNINGGAKYIKKMISRFGDYEIALAAYNAGPGNVKKYGGIPPFEETQVYVKRVMDTYSLFLTEQPKLPY